MSSSTRRIEASRANGARSHGPVTDAGKEMSSQNAIKHGLLSRIVVLKNEGPTGFADVMAEHLERFQPADGVEYEIVEEMVTASWQLRRGWSIETRLLDESFNDAEPGTDGTSALVALFKNPDDAHAIELLQRYQTGHQCAYQRALSKLLRLRKELKPPEPNEPTEPLAPKLAMPERGEDTPEPLEAGLAATPATAPAPPPVDEAEQARSAAASVEPPNVALGGGKSGRIWTALGDLIPLDCQTNLDAVYFQQADAHQEPDLDSSSRQPAVAAPPRQSQLVPSAAASSRADG